MHTCNHSPWEAEAGMFQALLDYTVRPQKKSENSGKNGQQKLSGMRGFCSQE